MSVTDRRVALVIGASRGLGLGLVQELLKRGFHVIGTVRDPAVHTPLHEIKGSAEGRLEIEGVEINSPDQTRALRSRLEGRGLDLLFVNAGVSLGMGDTIGAVSTEDFTRVFITNALSPMRVVEGFFDLVRPDGVVAVMSSSFGSVTLNTGGALEVYRASKAALNMLMRSFAARHQESPWALVTMDPGWVRTDMGGSEAPLDVETSMRGVADVIETLRGKRGLVYQNYQGETLPW